MSELKQIKDTLRLLKVSPNGIKFYLASFTNGRATIGQIALLCRMDRSSAYLAANQLKEMGLVEEDHSEKRKTIVAKPPKAVLARLRTDIRKMRRHADEIEEAMPTLLAAYQTNDSKPVLQFFSGVDGLKQIAQDVLDSADGEILLLSNQEQEKNVFTENDHKEFVQGRLERGLKMRVLVPECDDTKQLQKEDGVCLRETRIIYDENPFNNETYIYNDKVAMLSFDKEIVGFIVRSKDFAKAQRWLFEQVWKKSGHKDGELHG